MIKRKNLVAKLNEFCRLRHEFGLRYFDNPEFVVRFKIGRYRTEEYNIHAPSREVLERELNRRGLRWLDITLKQEGG